MSRVTRRQFVICTGSIAGASLLPRFSFEAESNVIEPQPYFAAVKRAIEALAKLGAPLVTEDAQRLTALATRGDVAAVGEAEKILDRYTLTRVVTDADGYAHASAGGAQRTLIEQGWRVFLIRVSNPVGNTDKLKLSGLTESVTVGSTGAPRVEDPAPWNVANSLAEAWLTGQLYETAPMTSALSGFPIEYGVIQLYSRDRGQREAHIYFYTSTYQFAEALVVEFRRGVRLLFQCLPSREVNLHVRDADGRPCVASLTIKDRFDRIYPLQAMRLAPDMPFHAHIYRADGETVLLPDGEYAIESKRGPEYIPVVQTVTISNAQNQIDVQLERWINPAAWGWYSGDTHIHAGGCSHYEYPTEGVSPETMIRHVRGEALSVGDVLSWGPSWYYQKQFFAGHAESPQAALEHPKLQAVNNAVWRTQSTPEDPESLLRYDVEVSGFPSSHCGHLVLLRLKEQDYPGTKIIQDWPSWNLPILRWARAQGAVAGYAHCGHGMVVDSTELPNYEIPPMDGAGTQEAIVDVTHGLADFISGCDTQPTAELNAWYHMLNCGFRLALIGETDYPCITGERPGVGRSYVRLEQRPVDDAGYDAWVRNLQKGRLYCGDGRSHFLDFKVKDQRSGEDDLHLKEKETLSIEALVAAHLEPEPTQELEPKVPPHHLNWGWNIERARLGKSRQVPIELVINGVAVDKTNLIADGKPRLIEFKTPMVRSSWIALRILPSSHTHPVFVQVGGKPIRASKKSAKWCRACVDKVWEVKSPFMRESERPAAAEAFDYARKVYDKIIAECEVE